MMDASDPMNSNASRAGLGRGRAAAVFLGLVAIYVVTAPTNHSLSVDAYYYALMITRDPVTDVQNPRLFLWIAAMKGLYQAGAAIAPGIDVFRLVGLANAIQAALAVMLIGRLLARDFALDQRSAWLTAALLASSYGIWRYATEIEVYASAVLISLLLVHAAFSLERGTPVRPLWRVIGLGVLGGIGTLVYQPIGIVAAVVIPFWLLARRRIGHLALYGAVAGAIVAAGFGLAYLLGTGAQAPAAEFVLQTNHLVPAVPTAKSFVKAAYAIGHDLLSTNWMFAVEPIRERFRLVEGFFLHHEHMFAAENAGLLVWVALVTLPAAAALGLMALATAWRFPERRRFDAREAAMILWLVAHGAMMLTLAPLGFEGWIPGLVPLLILAGIRIVEPCIAAGRSAVLLALVVVFVAHNGLVGIGTQLRESGDYLRLRGTALIERSGPGDLIVLTAHWNLDRYLRFAGTARTVIIEKDGVAAVRQAIEETLGGGGRVFVLDDVDTPRRVLSSWNRGLIPDIAALADDYLAAAERFATGHAGWAYRIERKEGAQ